MSLSVAYGRKNSEKLTLRQVISEHGWEKFTENLRERVSQLEEILGEWKIEKGYVV